jgi:hypothetical protein
LAIGTALWAVSREQAHGRWLLVCGFAAVTLSRSDGWLWALIVVAVGLLALGVTPRSLWRQLTVIQGVLIGAALAVAIVWSALVRPELIPVPTTATGWSLVSAVLRRTSAHLDEGVGLFGWADARIPQIAFYLWWAAVGGAAMAAAFSRRCRPLIASIVGFGLFVVSGWAADLVTARHSGLVWQGRYALPVLVAAVMVLGTPSPTRSDHDPVRWQPVVGAVAVAVWIAGAYQSLRRWSVGANGPLSPLEWERGGSAIHPMVCLIVFAVAACWCWWLLFDDDRGTFDDWTADDTAIRDKHTGGSETLR